MRCLFYVNLHCDFAILHTAIVMEYTNYVLAALFVLVNAVLNNTFAFSKNKDELFRLKI